MELYNRRKNLDTIELTIIPTTECPSNCHFCLQNKKLLQNDNWDNLFNNVIKVLSICDKKVMTHIVGGEIYIDKLITDNKFKDNLYKLFNLISYFKNVIISTTSSIENITNNGINVILDIKERYNCDFTVSFDEIRFLKDKDYFKKLEVLKPNYIGMLYSENNLYWYDILKKYCDNVYFEEAVMWDNYHYSYENIKIPFNKVNMGIHCSSPYYKTISSNGIYNCISTIKNISWIPDDDKEKLKNNVDDFLNENYKNVIEWYGCNECEYDSTCPGMCMLTYYAQRYIYNNRKCLYKC